MEGINMKTMYRKICLLILSLFLCSGFAYAYAGNIHAEIVEDEVETEDPTCTKDGKIVVLVRDVGVAAAPAFEPYYKEYVIPALGHNYIEQIITEASCTNDGLKRYACSRCGDSYDEIVKAYGHSYKKATSDPTCTEDGKETFTCSKCNDTYENVIPALGHDFKETDRIEPDCVNEGKAIEECRRCHEKKETSIAAKGHDYGEWIVELEPTIFKEGLKYRICSACSGRQEEAMPKLSFSESPTAMTVAAIAGGGAFIAGIFAAIKAKAKAIRIRPNFKFPKKVIIACFKDNELSNGLITLLDKKSYIKLKHIPYSEKDSLGEQAGIMQPNMIMLDIDDVDDIEFLKDTIANIKKSYSPEFGIIANGKLTKKLEEKLEALKEDGTIANYALKSDGLHDCLVKLVLPLYKLKKNKNSIANNISAIAAAMGIPVIPELAKLYTTYRDDKAYLKEIKKTIDNGDIGSSEAMSIISNIASILGCSTVRDVSTLLEDIKSAQKANE